jgi:uncharacterized Zn-finger protein
VRERRCYHCRVWAIVGQVTVIACAHCDKVFADWQSEPEDPERVAQSQTAHRTIPAHGRKTPCPLPIAWLMPEQRTAERGRRPAGRTAG